MRTLWAVTAISLWPLPALAQADANPVKSAGDAFGHKRGDEAIGLYDERSVRGFNLEAAGNYRLNGTYFVKNAGVSNFFIDSSTVRIGYNTLATLLPGPSGVVDYRLRDPQPGEKSLATATYDVYGQPIAELNFRGAAAAGTHSYSLGISRNFDVRNAQGGKGGEDLLVGGIARFTAGSTRIQMFAGEYQYRRRGEFRVIPGTNTLPERIERGTYLGQSWAFDEGQRRIAGLLVDRGVSAHSGIGATVAFGQEDPTRAFAQFFRVENGENRTSAQLLAIPQQRSTSWSSELRAFLESPRGRTHHRVDLFARYRRSLAHFGGAQTYSLAPGRLGERPADIAEPDLGGLEAGQQIVVLQTGLGGTYRGTFGKGLRINAGVLQSFYRKRYEAAAGESRSRSAPLVYNLGASLPLSRSVEVFASYARGLEEAGVAPGSAANRNEVLSAILVRQAEVGLRWALSDTLNLFATAFDSRKPYAGVDPEDNFYRFLGRVRHRGAELSFSGSPVAGLQIVAGGVLLDPRIMNEEDMSGPVLRPVAVPRYRGILNADWTVAGVRGLSFDAGLLHIGTRAARSSAAPGSRQLAVKALTTLNAGLRLAFSLGGNDAVVRAQILNITNRFAWDVNSSETLAYNEPRRARLLLTLRF